MSQDLTPAERKAMEQAKRSWLETEPLGTTQSFEPGWLAARAYYESELVRDIGAAARPAHEQLPIPDDLPSDLAKLLGDPSVIVRQDQNVFELIARWQKAPSTGAGE